MGKTSWSDLWCVSSLWASPWDLRWKYQQTWRRRRLETWSGSLRAGAASESPQQAAVCLWPSQGTRQELTRNSVFSSLSPSLRWSLLWIRLSCSRRASEQAVSRSPIRQKTLSSITTVGTSAPSSSTMTLLKWVLAPQPLYCVHVPLVLTPVSLMLVSPQAGPLQARAKGTLLAPWCICFPAPPVPGFCTTSPMSCCMQATKVHLAFPLEQMLCDVKASFIFLRILWNYASLGMSELHAKREQLQVFLGKCTFKECTCDLDPCVRLGKLLSF